MDIGQRIHHQKYQECKRKKRYPTEAIAYQQVSLMDKELRVYECIWCKGFSSYIEEGKTMKPVYVVVGGKLIDLTQSPKGLVMLTHSALLTSLGYSDKAAAYQQQFLEDK